MLAGLSPAALHAETRVALVIGNAGYATKPLANPARDADLMARALRSVGFDVTALVDADQAKMKASILDFGRRLRATDSVGLFYYAGHGVQVDGENFLIPVGADIRDNEEVAINSVNLTELLRTMERASARLNIAILDACRDNPFGGTSRSGAGGLAPVTAPSGTLIAYATAPGRVALDGRDANSPYTAALAAAIPTAGIPIEEVFRITRRKVLEVTSNTQTPWEHSSLTGEFFFRPKSAEPETSERDGGAGNGAADAHLAEIAEWETIKETTDPALLRRHLALYPAGYFSELAVVKLARLEEMAADGSPITTGSTSASPVAGQADAAAFYERAVKLSADTASEATLREAAELYAKAADLGLPAAMYELARAYDKGRGVGRDLATAAQWYRKAADAGHPGAMASLGTMHEFGEGVRLDLIEALRLYRIAAESGDPHAMTNLGYLYAEGKGVARDAVAARRWYGEAAEKGHARAMFNLALMHMRGTGGRPDLVEAVRLLKSAADRGHAGAMRELAVLFDEGRGVARNPREAARYLLMAYKAGDRQARADILKRPDTWSFSTRREIQKQLAAQGHYNGPAIGLFGPRTRAALDRLAAQR